MKTFKLATNDSSDINLMAAMDIPGYSHISQIAQMTLSYYPFSYVVRWVYISAKSERAAIKAARAAMFGFLRILPEQP